MHQRCVTITSKQSENTILFSAFMKLPILTNCVQVFIPACIKCHNSAVVEICLTTAVSEIQDWKSLICAINALYFAWKFVVVTVLDQRQCNGWEQGRSVDGGGHGGRGPRGHGAHRGLGKAFPFQQGCSLFQLPPWWKPRRANLPLPSQQDHHRQTETWGKQLQVCWCHCKG